MEFVLIEDYNGEQGFASAPDRPSAAARSTNPSAAAPPAPHQKGSLSEWFLQRIRRMRSGSVGPAPAPPGTRPGPTPAQAADGRPLAKVVDEWVQQTPVVVTLTGPAAVGKEFLLNALLQTTLKDAASYLHVYDDAVNKWEGGRIDETLSPDPSFFASLDWEREQRAQATVVDFALTLQRPPPGDDEHAFLLPQAPEPHGFPVYHLRYGHVFELIVSFPSESELRLALWELHEPAQGRAALDPQAAAALRTLYALVLSTADPLQGPGHSPAAAAAALSVQVPPPGCRSPQEIPLPAHVRAVLGKTFSFRGHGQDLTLDRLFLREKLKQLSRAHFAFFAKELVLRAPCRLLDGQVELHLAASDALDSLSRAKAAACLKSSNLLLVAVGAAGMTPDLHAALASSGCLERLVAKLDDHKAVFLELPPHAPFPWSVREQRAAVTHTLQQQLRRAMLEKLPASLSDKVERVVANSSVLCVRPLLFASVALNEHLPLELHGYTLSELKSFTGIPSLLGAIHNMKIAKCAAPLRDLTSDWVKAPDASGSGPVATSALPPRVQQISETLEEKLKTWKADLASSARNLDALLETKAEESAAHATSSWEPFKVRYLQTNEACRTILSEKYGGQCLGADMPALTCGDLLEAAPGVWQHAVLASAPQRMSEVLAAHEGLLQEAAQAVERQHPAEGDERVRLRKLVGFCRQLNERKMRARMDALREEVLQQDPGAVVAGAVRDVLAQRVLAPAASLDGGGVRSYQALVQGSLPEVPREAARKIQQRFGALLGKYEHHVVSMEHELATSVRFLQHIMAPPDSSAPAPAPMQADETQPLAAQFEDMAIDGQLQPTAQEHKSSRTNSLAPAPAPAPSLALAPALDPADDDALGPALLTDELWERLADRPDPATASRASTPREYEAALRRAGLQAVDVRFDGSAQFRAVAHQVYGTEEAHPIVRMLVMGEILQHMALYAPCIERRRRVSAEEYVSQLCRENEWGDRVTLLAAANLYAHHLLLRAPAAAARPLLLPSARAPAPFGPGSAALTLAVLGPNHYQSLVARERRVSLLQPPDATMADLDGGGSGPLSKNSSSTSLSSDASMTASDSDSSDALAHGHKRRSRGSSLSAADVQLQPGLMPPRRLRSVSTLTELCIQKIGLHLDMMPALDGCLPEELLQRLLTYLVEENKLHNQVLYRLVDASLFTLSLDHCKQLNDTSCAIIARACPNLRRLSLEACTGVSCEGLVHLADRCAALELLNLDGCSLVADQAVRAVAAKCPNLLVLHLGATRVTDAGLQALAACRNLHSLSVRRCALLTDQALAALPSELLQLDASECPRLGDPAVLHIAQRCHATLQQLKLSAKGLRDQAVAQLAQRCTNLRQLELVGCELLTDQAVAAVARCCPLLTSLSLAGCRKLTLELALERPMAHLQHLDLSRCLAVTDAAVQRWVQAYCPLLGTLNLSACEQLSDVALRAVAAHCPHLRALHLSKCRRLTDAALLEVLRRCPHLQRLSLHNCTVSDASVEQAARYCRELVELDLACCDRVGDATVRAVAGGCPELEVLSLEELPLLTDVGVAALAEHCRALHTVKLGHCKNLTDAALQQLSAGCRQMRSIDLSHCNGLSVAGIQRALDAWPALRSLGLRGYNHLSSEGLEHARLETLNLSWSKNLEDTALIFIAERCPRLASLDIAWCSKVSDYAVHRFAQKNSVASALRTLNLRGCTKISELLVKLLSGNKRLQIFR